MSVSFCVDATVEFVRSTYSIDESGGSVELKLIISEPSSFPYNVTVTTIHGSATGKPLL